MRRNDQIRISPLRVIAENGEQLGIVSNDEAQQLARDAGLDLVEMAPNVRPPVCRIMDYGKWKYLQKKKGSKSHEQILKEVRLRPKTDEHDRSIKVKRARRFLEHGAKVQFTMRFRGRERAHRHNAMEALREIAAGFGDCVKIERPPSMDGRNMIMILSPVKAAFDRLAADDAESKPEAGPDEKAAGKPASADPALGDRATTVSATADPSPEKN